MASPHGHDRRTLLRGSLAATAAGAIGLGSTGTAHAAPAAEGRGTASPARAAVAEPRIYSTAEWGARPPSDSIVVLDQVPTYIVVHHTANPGNSTDYSLAHAMEICRSIQNFHMDSNGWIDSGQQFTNSRGGYRLEGRHQSLSVVRGGTQHVQGANVGGYNSQVIGIENEGLYTSVDVPQALWDSLVDLVAWIADRYGTTMPNIRGHRDFNSTECPGDVLYGRLQELRDEVAVRLGTAPAQRFVPWPLLRPGDFGPRVRAAQHLLRAKGFTSVPADGHFGASTKEAVERLAKAHDIKAHSCAAMYHSTVDETGWLGSDLWPLITPSARSDHEVAAAVAELERAGSRDRSVGTTLTQSEWKLLLA